MISIHQFLYNHFIRYLPESRIKIWLGDLFYRDYNARCDIKMTAVIVHLLHYIGIDDLFTPDNKTCLAGGALRVIEELMQKNEYDPLADELTRREWLNTALARIRDFDIFVVSKKELDIAENLIMGKCFIPIDNGNNGRYLKSIPVLTGAGNIDVCIDIKICSKEYLDGKMMLHIVDLTTSMCAYNDQGSMFVTNCAAFKRSVKNRVITYNRLALKMIPETYFRCFLDQSNRWPDYDKRRLMTYLCIESKNIVNRMTSRYNESEKLDTSKMYQPVQNSNQHKSYGYGS